MMMVMVMVMVMVMLLQGNEHPRSLACGVGAIVAAIGLSFASKANTIRPLFRRRGV